MTSVSLSPISDHFDDTDSNNWSLRNLHPPQFWEGQYGLEGYLQTHDYLNWISYGRTKTKGDSLLKYRYQYPIFIGRILPLIWRVYQDEDNNIFQIDTIRSITSGRLVRRYLTSEKLRAIIWSEIKNMNRHFRNNTVLQQFFEVDGWVTHGVVFSPKNEHFLKYLPQLRINSNAHPLLEIRPTYDDGPEDFKIYKFVLSSTIQCPTNYFAEELKKRAGQVLDQELFREIYITTTGDSRVRLPSVAKLNQLISEHSIHIEKKRSSKKDGNSQSYSFTIKDSYCKLTPAT